MKPILTLIPQRPVVCHDRPTTLTVLVQAQAPRSRVAKRPNLNIGLCIDRSSSMAGPPIERARQAGCHILGQLAPTDVISVVAFSNAAETLTPSREVGTSAHSVLECLLRLSAQGHTALHDGWLESVHQVNRGACTGRLSRVLLLSDGVANVGLTDSSRLAAEVSKWTQRGISTTTIGLGEGYNEDLLLQLARAGHGNFHHVRTVEDILSTFQMELHGLFSTFGSDVSFGLKPASGVELLRVVNPLEQTSQGRWNVADLVHGHPVELVLEFLVPEGLQESQICTVDLRYTEVQTGTEFEVCEELRLPSVPHGQLCEFPANQEVMRKQALQDAAGLMKNAVSLMGSQDHDLALGKLKEAISSLEQLDATAEVNTALKQLRQMTSDLRRGHTSQARKQASSYYASSSSSSVVSLPGLREFLALPEEQRTPEKFQELTGHELS